MIKKNKPIIATIKLQIKAKSATPAPPVGSAVGPWGINIMGFCQEFNKITASYPDGAPVPVIITIYKDKNFSFICKSLPASFLIKRQALTDEKGQLYITKERLLVIAKAKASDLTALSDEAMINTLAGSAKSMGVKVVKA